ncbi:unnamed protein product [Pylaiella littoralis]
MCAVVELSIAVVHTFFFRATRFIEFCLGGACKSTFFFGGAFRLVCIPFFSMLRGLLNFVSEARAKVPFFRGCFSIGLHAFFFHSTGFIEFCLGGACKSSFFFGGAFQLVCMPFFSCDGVY